MRRNKNVYNPYKQFATLNKEQLQPINSIEASATAWAMQVTKQIRKKQEATNQQTLFTSAIKYVSPPKYAGRKYVFSGAIPLMLPSILIIKQDIDGIPTCVTSQYTLHQQLVYNSHIPAKTNIIDLFKLVKDMINNGDNKDLESINPDVELIENYKLYLGIMFHSWFYDTNSLPDVLQCPEEANTRFNDVYKKLEAVFNITLNNVSELISTYHPLCIVSFKFEFPILYSLTKESINKYIDKYPRYLELVPKARLLYPHEQLFNPIIPLILTNVYHTLLQEQYNKHQRLAQQSQISSSHISELSNKENRDILNW